jgi:hypothetical protein
MEELLGGIDMGELQKELLSDPKMNQTVQAVLNDPEALDTFKNFFKGGSKWRNKHRKKRGSGGKHSKQMTSMYTPSSTFPSVAGPTKKEPEQDQEMSPIRKRRNAFDGSMENDPFGPMPHRESAEEKAARLLAEENAARLLAEEKAARLLEDGKAMKAAINKKHDDDVKNNRKVLYGGKWSLKYKRSINCRKPKGFSQKQYCKKKNRKSRKKRKKSRKKRKRKRKRTRRKRR